MTLPPDYLDAGHLHYGYATTIHKAQGATVDRAFLLGSETLYREAGYVGLSRARQRTDLYIVTAPADQKRDLDPVAELISRLATSRAQTMASDELHRHQEGERLHQLSKALLADPPAWSTELLGEPPVQARERDRWGRDAGRIATYLEAFADRGACIEELTGPRRDPPTDRDHRQAWEMARLTLAEHHRHLDLARRLEPEGLHL